MTYTCVSIAYNDMIYESAFQLYKCGLMCRAEKMFDTVDFWDTWDESEEVGSDE